MTMEGAEESAQKLGYLQTVASTFTEHLTKKFAGMFSAVAVGTMAFEKLEEAMKKNLSTARQISAMSAKFHIDPEQVHSLMITANKAGVNVRMLMMSMKQLGQFATKSLIDKNKADVFKQIGIDVEQLSDVASKPAKHLADIAVGLMKIKDVGQRTEAGTMLMGRGYQQMMPIIEKIGTSEEAREEFLHNENALTKEQVEMYKALAMAQMELEESWNKLVANLSPWIQGIILGLDLFTKLGDIIATIAENMGLINLDKVGSGSVDVYKAIDEKAIQLSEELKTSEGKKKFEEWQKIKGNSEKTENEYIGERLKERGQKAFEEDVGVNHGRATELYNNEENISATSWTKRLAAPFAVFRAIMAPTLGNAMEAAEDYREVVSPTLSKEDAEKSASRDVAEKALAEKLMKEAIESKLKQTGLEGEELKAQTNVSYRKLLKSKLSDADFTALMKSDYGVEGITRKDGFMSLKHKVVEDNEEHPVLKKYETQLPVQPGFELYHDWALGQESQYGQETARKTYVELAKEREEERKKEAQRKRDAIVKWEVKVRKFAGEKVYFDEKTHSMQYGDAPEDEANNEFINKAARAKAETRAKRTKEQLAKSRRHLATGHEGVEAAEEAVESATGDLEASIKNQTEETEKLSKAKEDVIQKENKYYELQQEIYLMEGRGLADEKEKLKTLKEQFSAAEQNLKHARESEEDASNAVDQAEIKRNTAFNAQMSRIKALAKAKEQEWFREYKHAEEAARDEEELAREKNEYNYKMMKSNGEDNLSISKQKFQDELGFYQDAIEKKEELERRLIELRDNDGRNQFNEQESAALEKAVQKVTGERKKVQGAFWEMGSKEGQAVVSDLGKVGGGRAVQWSGENIVDQLKRSNRWLEIIANQGGTPNAADVQDFRRSLGSPYSSYWQGSRLPDDTPKSK